MKKTYAMILQNEVIGIVQNQDTKPHWEKDFLGNPVVPIQCDETVEIGMIYNSETGEFSKYVPTPRFNEPTQLDRIEEMVSKSNEQLRQEGAEALTLELIEGGIL